MEELFEKFTHRYSKEMDKTIHKSDEQRSVRNPVLFVFLGDKSIEASKKVYSNIKSEWDNGDGILFFNIFSREKFHESNVFNFNISYDKKDIKNLRRNIYDKFYSDYDLLADLNKEIVKIKNSILEHGEEFLSFEKINIAVITRADDELNILIPELTLLIKTKLSQHFLITACDLYTLLETRTEDENDEFHKGALAVSFFNEMKVFQSPSFSFEREIEVFDQNRKLLVKWTKPIFDLVYVLSDVNKKGIVKKNSFEENYNIISYISLIKNRKINSESYYDIKNKIYDDNIFKRNISDDKGEVSLSTAGLAVIRRPNSAVSMAVLSCVYEDMLSTLKDTSKIKEIEVLSKIELDEETVHFKVNKLMPEGKSVEDMMSIMTVKSRFDGERITLREAEKALYNGMCSDFYNINFFNYTNEKLRNIDFKKIISEGLEKIAKDPKMGVYAAYLCTKDNEIVDTLNERVKEYDISIKKLQGEIDAIYESEIKRPSFFKAVLGKSEIVRDIKNQIFNEIYFRKIKMLEIQLNSIYLKNCIAELLNLKTQYQELINKLTSFKEKIDSYTLELIKENDNYIGQNINEYYEGVVKEKLSKMKEKFGDNFYFSKGFLPNIYDMIKYGTYEIIWSIQDICVKYILTEKEFSMAFEDELNKRTNMSTVGYNKEISTKDEIFKNLCMILENKSALKAFIIDYNVVKYEEKYFFGDYSSDFIKYVYDFDKKSKSCEIGYIHERRATGIEKLSLMGGFKIKDLIYYKNSLKYYEAALEEGYILHRQM